MENINLQLLRKINCLLTGLLAIIGFSCGENGEIPCEYGSPHANFQIKGKVTDMKGEPIPDLQVRINPSGESHPQGWYIPIPSRQIQTEISFLAKPISLSWNID